MQTARREDLSKLSCELKARTEANEDEAEDIWEAAQEVVQRVNDFNAALTTNETGYDTEYVGCYRDRGQRDLPKIFGNYAAQTRAACLAEAKAQGFKYIGHQYGGECWMSNDFGKYGKVDDSECNMACKLEADLTCGGSWRNSIWSLTPFNPEERRIEQAKEVNDSVKGIIADIDEARKNVMVAHRLAKKLAWITGGDLRYLEHARNLDLAGQQ